MNGTIAEIVLVKSADHSYSYIFSTHLFHLFVLTGHLRGGVPSGQDWLTVQTTGRPTRCIVSGIGPDLVVIYCVYYDLATRCDGRVG